MGMIKDELYFKPRLSVIDSDQIEQIHCATLEVLERTGVDIPHDRALEILHGNGATVEGQRVRMPSFEQRLQEITLKTMKHRPEPLPKDVVKTLDDMQSGWR